jgi:hypothetical protein
MPLLQKGFEAAFGSGDTDAAARLEFHRWLYWRILSFSNPTMPVRAQAFLRAGKFQNAGVAAAALEAFTGGSGSQGLLDAIAEIVSTWLQQAYQVLKWEPVPPECGPKLAINLGIDDAGLRVAFEAGRNAALAYRTNEPAVVAAANEGRQAQLPPETPDFPVKDMAMAKVAERALLNHINANISYYYEAIWRSMDEDHRMTFLAMFGKLPDYVENEVVGFVGTKAVMPYRLANHPEAKPGSTRF